MAPATSRVTAVHRIAKLRHRYVSKQRKTTLWVCNKGQGGGSGKNRGIAVSWLNIGKQWRTLVFAGVCLSLVTRLHVAQHTYRLLLKGSEHARLGPSILFACLYLLRFYCYLLRNTIVHPAILFRSRWFSDDRYSREYSWVDSIRSINEMRRKL